MVESGDTVITVGLEDGAVRVALPARDRDRRASSPSASRTSTCSSAIQVAPLRRLRLALDGDRHDREAAQPGRQNAAGRPGERRKRREAKGDRRSGRDGHRPTQGGGPRPARRASCRSRSPNGSRSARLTRTSSSSRSSRSRSSAGRRTASVLGFLAGLVLDTASFGTFGLTSLLLTVIGYWTGRFGEATTRSSAHPLLIAVAFATVGVTLGSAVLHFMLGVTRSPPRSSSSRVLLPALAFNLILAYPLYALCARLLPPRLVVRREVNRLSSTVNDPDRPGFLPPDPRVEEPYRFSPQMALRVGDPRRDRGRRLLRALLPPLGAAGDLRRALPREREQQPDPQLRRHRAARLDRRPRRRRPRLQQAGHARADLAGRPRERPRRASATRCCVGWRCCSA